MNSIGFPILFILLLHSVVPPDITHISGNQRINDGNEVRLNCSADGKPKPNITWTRVSDNSVVTFPLTISKLDSGLYRCTADNGIGNPATADVFIAVQCKYITR